MVAGTCAAVVVLVALDLHLHGSLYRLDVRVSASRPRFASDTWQTRLADVLANVAAGPVEILLLVVVAAVCAGVQRRWGPLLSAGVAAVALTALVLGVKILVARDGPRDAGALGHGGAFPSGHAAAAAAVGLVGALLVGGGSVLARTVLLLLAVCWAALVGWSRVYLDLHWTSDVVAGWALGGLVAAVTVLVGERWWPRPVPPGEIG
jgi:undecaprenyl-diphosphatase